MNILKKTMTPRTQSSDKVNRGTIWLLQESQDWNIEIPYACHIWRIWNFLAFIYIYMDVCEFMLFFYSAGTASLIRDHLYLNLHAQNECLTFQTSQPTPRTLMPMFLAEIQNNNYWYYYWELTLALHWHSLQLPVTHTLH